MHGFKRLYVQTILDTHLLIHFFQSARFCSVDAVSDRLQACSLRVTDILASVSTLVDTHAKGKKK